jgi:hypothetical protein
MDRILGPAPALPAALATPIAQLAPVSRAGAPDSTPPKSSFERRLAGQTLDGLLRPTVTPTVAATATDTFSADGTVVNGDVDLRSVYALRVANSPAAPDGNP